MKKDVKLQVIHPLSFILQENEIMGAAHEIEIVQVLTILQSRKLGV